MSKSNIELATEITIAYVESWNEKSNTVALKLSDVTDVITTIYRTLEKLD